MSIARRIHMFFSVSEKWKTHDVFSRQKTSDLRSSYPLTCRLATQHKLLIDEIANKQGEEQGYTAERATFTELCMISLWGNLTDQTRDGTRSSSMVEAFTTRDENLIVNDLPIAFEALKNVQRQGKKDRTISIVLARAGFELYTDLLLATYLLASDLATQIVLHPKSMPWFVSDATPTDFAVLLSAIAQPQSFFTPPLEETYIETPHIAPSSSELSDLAFLFEHWTTLYCLWCHHPPSPPFLDLSI